MADRRDIKTLARDDQGAILVFFAIALGVILGLVALSFDIGERAATQTELQSFADQVALAAAGELDGRSDAITRAAAAAANLITDKQSFATGSHTLSGTGDYTLTYFSTLPAADTSALTSGSTTNPALAQYVRATVTPRTVPYTFMGAFNALTGTTNTNSTITASAVAGFNQYACDITPLMFCIPNSSFKADQNVGKMILLRTAGQGAAWGPGDFGFLDLSKVTVDTSSPCYGINSAPQKTRCLIGAINPLKACFSQRGVDIEPGQKQGIETGAFNIRFEMYEGNMSQYLGDANYPTAPSIIKGLVPKNGQCKQFNTSSNTAALPRDTCLGTSSCPNGGGGRIGNGVFSWSNYITKNYNGTNPFPTATTRYQFYLAEINAHKGPPPTNLLPSGKAETGLPQCSAARSTDTDRRVLTVAGVDCSANAIQGSANNIPVTEFVRMFITEPAGGSGNNFDIYAEVIGSAQTSSTGGLFHDVVQLYR